MKKTLLLMGAMLLSLGTFAQDAYKTLTFPDDNSANNSVSAYTETWTAKIGTDEWTITNFNNNKWANSWTYIRCGSKKAASVASIASPAIDKAVSSVVVTIDKVTADKVNSIKLVVASDAAFATEVETVEASAIATGELTFTTTKAAENNYYKVVFDCAQGSSNGLVQVSKVAYYAAGTVTKESAGLKFSESSISIEEGKEFTAPTFTKATDATVTFTSDNEEVAKVDADGVITLAGGLGKATITATAPETDTYNAGEATCTVEVFKYNYYTKATAVESGKSYLLVAQRDEATYYAYPLSSTKTYGYLSTGKISSLTDTIRIKSSYDDSFVFLSQDGGYSIEDADGRYYVQSGSYKSLQIADEPAAWTVDAQEDGTFKIAMNGYYIQFGQGTYTSFGVYTEDQENAVLPFLYVYDSNITTGITNTVVEKTANADAPRYNLAGQRVGAAYKGVVIQNGKKFIVK